MVRPHSHMVAWCAHGKVRENVSVSEGLCGRAYRVPRTYTRLLPFVQPTHSANSFFTPGCPCSLTPISCSRSQEPVVWCPLHFTSFFASLSHIQFFFPPSSIPNPAQHHLGHPVTTLHYCTTATFSSTPSQFLLRAVVTPGLYSPTAILINCITLIPFHPVSSTLTLKSISPAPTLFFIVPFLTIITPANAISLASEPLYAPLRPSSPSNAFQGSSPIARPLDNIDGL